MKGAGKECAVVARKDAGTTTENARLAEFVYRAARGVKARLVKTAEKDGKFMCGVVCPVGSANGLAQTLRAAGYDVTVTPKKETPNAAAKPAPMAESPKEGGWKPSARTPMPRIEQTREAVHGCHWGDPMMKAVLLELGLAKDPMRIASNPGRHFGFFRIDPVKFARMLGLKAMEPQNGGRWTANATSAEISAAAAKKYGKNSAVAMFWEEQCVGFNPDLINNKTKNRKVKK